jgi:kynurenine formamidase
MQSEDSLWLSHILTAEAPAYGDGEHMRIEAITRISHGETANTTRYVIPNHLGTHLDAPLHFADGASSLTDYDSAFWIFNRPQLIDVPGEDGHLVGPADISESIEEGTDLLLLRTGYEEYRTDDRYWARSPGLHQDLGRWLRAEHTTVRIVGMDVISVTSRLHRKEGREAHRALLDPTRPGDPVLALEDMALRHVEGHLTRVIVLPLRVGGADGGPCTVIGFTGEEGTR